MFLSVPVSQLLLKRRGIAFSAIWILISCMLGPHIVQGSAPLSDVTIREAVSAWLLDPTNATAIYGPMGTWNTSLVTNMESLFDADYRNSRDFNEDLSLWDTSQVTTMKYLFYSASSFNGNISTWKTSRVQDFVGMFAGASAFNRDLSQWDTSSATSMYAMFAGASSFNSSISSWKTSQVTDVSAMFSGASAFNSDVSKWDTSHVTNMDSMFYGASSFNGNVSLWNTSSVYEMSYMFSGASSFNQTLCWDTSKATKDRQGGGISSAKLGDWMPCASSSQCMNGCCSPVYSDGVLKCTPGGYNPSICVGGSATVVLGDWTPCSSSSQCANKCCSSQYSEGVNKCTPLNFGFDPIQNGCVGYEFSTKRGDWAVCTESSQCHNGCCSSIYSNGILKCTPDIGFIEGTCVEGLFDGSNGSFNVSPYPTCVRSQLLSSTPSSRPTAKPSTMPSTMPSIKTVVTVKPSTLLSRNPLAKPSLPPSEKRSSAAALLFTVPLLSFFIAMFFL